MSAKDPQIIMLNTIELSGFNNIRSKCLIILDHSVSGFFFGGWGCDGGGNTTGLVAYKLLNWPSAQSALEKLLSRPATIP